MKLIRSWSFYIGFFLPIVLVGLLTSFGFLFLSKAGEYKSTQEIVKHQLKKGGLYSSGLHGLTHSYKVELYKAIKPDVVALGSSRVMQFRSHVFKVPFVTMGGAMSGPLEGKVLVDKMFAEHVPKVVLLGIDFWWLNDRRPEPISFPNHRRHLDHLDVELSHLFEPYKWVMEDKIETKHIHRVLRSTSADQGVSALVWGDGYDQNGTYYYSSIVTGKRPSNDQKFAQSLANIKNDRNVFVWNSHISMERLAELDMLIATIREYGAEPIVFLPPVAPTVAEAMEETGRYGYIAELQAALTDMSRQFFDFHDGGQLDITDCEFIDGTHGGVIVYDRILLNMAMNPYTDLHKYVDLSRLKEEIMNHFGHASLRGFKEKDFLGLGCDK